MNESDRCFTIDGIGVKIFPKASRSRLDRIDAKKTPIDKAICKLLRSIEIHRKDTKASSIIHDRFS